MSGTSLDGLDAVLARFTLQSEGYRAEIVSHVRQTFPGSWASEAHRIQSKNLLRESYYLGAVWAEVGAKAVHRLLGKSRKHAREIDVLGAHGQTLVHLPRPRAYLGYPVGITIQSGDLSRLSIRTGIRVVGNFRAADLAVGGQGAPMAPYAHRLLFGRQGKTVAIQNLGGMGNVTVLTGHRLKMAFDTGPANVWIDTVVRWRTANRLSFDLNGRLARSGRPHFRLVEKLLAHPFFNRIPPKSAGWENFGPSVLSTYRSALSKMPTPDALSTVTYATAIATSQAYRRFVFPHAKPSEMIVAGGGAKNIFFMEVLSQLLPELRVVSSSTYGIEPDQVEALAFALLALETIRGRANNEPLATGAKKSIVCGQIALP
jgi:anhydro-N-acetylmuramic acid kinase